MGRLKTLEQYSGKEPQFTDGQEKMPVWFSRSKGCRRMATAISPLLESNDYEKQKRQIWPFWVAMVEWRWAVITQVEGMGVNIRKTSSRCSLLSIWQRRFLRGITATGRRAGSFSRISTRLQITDQAKRGRRNGQVSCITAARMHTRKADTKWQNGWRAKRRGAVNRG